MASREAPATDRPQKEAKIVQMIQDIKANETQSTQASAIPTTTAADVVESAAAAGEV